MAPNSKVRFESRDIGSEMKRLAREIGASDPSVKYGGVCELVASQDVEQIVHTMFHVFSKPASDLPKNSDIDWIDISTSLELAPGLASIIAVANNDTVGFISHYHKS